MDPNKKKAKRRLRRRHHVRRTLAGSAERPRLTIYRSLRYTYAQLVDDVKGTTLAACSSLEKAVKGKVGNTRNQAAAQAVGEELARRALAAGIQKIAFDRNGFKFHGRVKALADGARKGGLEF